MEEGDYVIRPVGGRIRIHPGGSMLQYLEPDDHIFGTLVKIDSKWCVQDVHNPRVFSPLEYLRDTELSEPFKWHPWEDWKHLTRKTSRHLGIEEPPCKHCKYWWSLAEFNPDGSFSGVRCCWNTEQYIDFSCFRGKENEKD